MQQSIHSYSQAVASAAAEIESRIRTLLPLLDALERALNVEAEALALRDAQALLSAVETKRQGLRSLEAALAETNLAALVESLAKQSSRSGNGESAPRGSHSWLKNELFAAAVPSWQPLLERVRRVPGVAAATPVAAGDIRQ